MPMTVDDLPEDNNLPEEDRLPEEDKLPEDYDALKVAFIEMRAKVLGAEALIEHLRLGIAKMKREMYAPRSERSPRRPAARAAAATSARRLARTSPRRSTWCRGKCSSPSTCVRSSAAGPARRSASRRLRFTPSPVASR